MIEDERSKLVEVMRAYCEKEVLRALSALAKTFIIKIKTKSSMKNVTNQLEIKVIEQIARMAYSFANTVLAMIA